MKKIVIIGPESTGKSTLCEDLATHFKCDFVKEYARDYLNEFGPNYSYEHVLNMAEGQAELEASFIEMNADLPFIFIDTNQYVYKVWIEDKFDKVEPIVESLIQNNRYDYYFLCDIDVPWEYDEFREDPNEDDRQRFFDRYQQLLEADGTPFTILTGKKEDRLSKAIDVLNRLK